MSNDKTTNSAREKALQKCNTTTPQADTKDVKVVKDSITSSRETM